MKRKRDFSQKEAESIREFLSEKIQQNRSAQKRTRHKLRTRRFYITDFEKRYPTFIKDDFDSLVSSGDITIK